MSLGYGRLIKGSFYVRASTSPDGDSMRFIPDQPPLFKDLNGYAEPDFGNQNPWNLQLRFEAIDTPELHYGDPKIKAEVKKQPQGMESRNGLLKWLGVEPKEWNWEVAPAGFDWRHRVAIICSGMEGHGRPLSFVLKDADVQQLTDGADVKVDSVLKDTYNYHAAETGLAYLGFYGSATSDTRNALITAMNKARSSKLGIWRIDSTSMFKVDSFSDITENGALIYPKLFRRCVDALKSYNGQFQQGKDLGDWLAGEGKKDDDQMIVYSTDGGKVKVSLSSVIQQVNNKVRVTVDLNTVDFISK